MEGCGLSVLTLLTLSTTVGPVFGKTTYSHVGNVSQLKQVFEDIRQEVELTTSQQELLKFYRQAGYLVALTATPAWTKRFGQRITAIKDTAKLEFTATANEINRRAKTLGFPSRYDTTWGP
jgi:hypothetical protein